jgi:hypothetical protein
VSTPHKHGKSSYQCNVEADGCILSVLVSIYLGCGVRYEFIGRGACHFSNILKKKTYNGNTAL